MLTELLDRLAEAVRATPYRHCGIETCEQCWQERNARKAIEAHVAELSAENERYKERRFPIQGGPSLPWSMIEPYNGQALLNHGQSLETLAARGGLDPTEAWCVMNNQDLAECRNVSSQNARQWLVNQVSRVAELSAELAEWKSSGPDCVRMLTEKVAELEARLVDKHKV